MTTLRLAPARQRPTMAAVRPGPLVAWLVVAALAELLILRSFTRTAVHIPALEQLAGPYTVVADVGRYAYYVAATLLVVAIPIVALELWEASRAGRLASLALGEFALGAIGLRLGSGEPALWSLCIVAAVVTAGFAAGLRDRWTLLLSGAFALAFAASAMDTALQSELAMRLGLWSAGWLLPVAEIAGVVTGLVAPFALRAGRSRKQAIAAAAAGGLTLALLLGSGPTTRILLLWNEGLSGTLPSVVYAVAAGALTWTIAGCWRQGRRRDAFALLLLIAGGFGLHSTYQSGLVVVALALVALPATTGDEGRGLAGRRAPAYR